MDSYGINILLLITNKNGPMLIKSFCLFRQNLSDISDLIFHQPDADPSSTKPHNLSLLSIVTKLLLRNISISLIKNTLYSVSS